MSLLDALLLDPAPFDVWIAVRTDGMKGSGTASDPYHGGGGKLDAILDGLPANTHIHLGPDTFDTSGYADGVSGGWQPKAGMKIEGSGIGVTTLRLVGTSQNVSYYAIGHALTTGGSQPNLLDFFEISDLTIDCNLTGQTPTQVSCAAIRIMGNHCRIRRVKAKNWGTKYGPNRCYVISAIIADPSSGVMEVVDAGIEDCIVVEPATASIPTTTYVTLIHAGGLEGSTHVESFGRAPFIRNCFLDGGTLTSGPELRGLSMSWCRGGVIEGNQIHNIKHGGPYQDKTSTRDLIVRNNHYRNVWKGPFFNLPTYGPSVGTATLSKTGVVVTATTTPDHKLFTRDRVMLDASPDTFDGWAEITVTANNKFTYNTSVSGTPVSASVIQKVFGVDRLVIEGNSISLAPNTSGNVDDVVGIYLNGAGLGPTDSTYPTYPHGDVIVRNNKIRFLDGAYEANFIGYGLQLNGAKRLIVENNVIESAQPNPMRNVRCGSVKYSNNRTFAGVLIRGYREAIIGGAGELYYDDLETDAEDAFVMAMFNER